MRGPAQALSRWCGSARPTQALRPLRPPGPLPLPLPLPLPARAPSHPLPASGWAPSRLAAPPVIGWEPRVSGICVRASQDGSGGTQKGTPAYRADNPDLPFAELGIAKISEKVGGVRVRQHANPLRREYQVPVEPLPWDATFADPTRPLALDIGSGYGRFLLMFDRKMSATHNSLGIEIRNPIVERANLWAKELGQDSRVAFISGNATVSVDSLLQTYPGELRLVTIQYPDPHFKKRHHKRRTVQKQLVEAIARQLPKGGRVFLQSDVEEVAAAMRDQFERHGSQSFALSAEHLEGRCFSCSEAAEEKAEAEDGWESEWAQHGWMSENPLGVPTEREVYVLEDGLPVYRAMLVRT